MEYYTEAYFLNEETIQLVKITNQADRIDLTPEEAKTMVFIQMLSDHAAAGFADSVIREPRIQPKSIEAQEGKVDFSKLVIVALDHTIKIVSWSTEYVEPLDDKGNPFS